MASTLLRSILVLLLSLISMKATYIERTDLWVKNKYYSTCPGYLETHPTISPLILSDCFTYCAGY